MILAVGLNLAYGTVRTDRGQTGTTVAHEHQVGGNAPVGLRSQEADPRNELRGRKGWRPPWPVF
jgi:hypothetical protein